MSLPPPRDLAAAPRVHLDELASHLGESATVNACVELLEGADPMVRPRVLAYLGGRPAVRVLQGDRRWPTWWARAWAARGLRYVWDRSAELAVLGGLDDEQWRVVEHCLALVAEHDLGPAGDQAVRQLEHELPRMRIAAARALAVAADTDHLSPLHARAIDDLDPRVRAAASRGWDLATARLDMPGADS